MQWLGQQKVLRFTLNYFDIFVELEINILFPTCWDGKNLESVDGSHVSYAVGCNADEASECFDLDCPSSHPVKMPEIDMFVRVLGYEGGAHVFSDGSDVRSNKIQTLLESTNLDICSSLINKFIFSRYFMVTTFLDGMRLHYRGCWTTVKMNQRHQCPMPFAVTG